MSTCLVHVELPFHLAILARTPRVISLALEPGATTASLLDELERRYPMLRGTVRDQATGERRPYLRFFCCQQDISQADLDLPLPESARNASEPFIILGAVAGG